MKDLFKKIENLEIEQLVGLFMFGVVFSTTLYLGGGANSIAVDDSRQLASTAGSSIEDSTKLTSDDSASTLQSDTGVVSSKTTIDEGSTIVENTNIDDGVGGIEGNTGTTDNLSAVSTSQPEEQPLANETLTVDPAVPQATSDGVTPRIALNGDKRTFAYGVNSYRDSGATAYDAQDGDITGKITKKFFANDEGVEGFVATYGQGALSQIGKETRQKDVDGVLTNFRSVPIELYPLGVFLIEYSVTDSTGNIATAERIVFVRPESERPEKPITEDPVEEPIIEETTSPDGETGSEELLVAPENPPIDNTQKEPETSTGQTEVTSTEKVEGETTYQRDNFFSLRTDTTTSAAPAPQPRTYVDVENQQRIEAIEKKIVEEVEKFERRNDVDLLKDSDGDGISDYDEVALYNTNPFNPYTEGGDRTDGEKLLEGINPASPTSEPIRFTDPRTDTETIVREDFTVESLEVLDTKPIPLFPNEKEVSKIAFSGRGLPHSYVTLYIFSTPIIVTVKTDSEGRWKYELDKVLEDGSHDIFVATVDNSGRIVAKSTPIPFVKQADAAVLGSSALVTVEESGFLRTNMILIMVVLGAIAVIIMVLIIGSARKPEHLEDFGEYGGPTDQ